jgi:hypothetical protein
LGGIVNSGTLSAGGSGILAIGVSTFTGGITNSGAISAGVSGIDLPTSGHSSAAIANSGKITGAATSKGTNEINLVPELAPSATLPPRRLPQAACSSLARRRTTRPRAKCRAVAEATITALLLISLF